MSRNAPRWRKCDGKTRLRDDESRGNCMAHIEEFHPRELGPKFEIARPDLFWAKVQKGDGCWAWTGYTNPDGYGYATYRNTDGEEHNATAHRVAWQLTHGLVPDGLSLDHLCRNRGCVNPAHLEPVTSAVNIYRGEGIAARNKAKTHCNHGHPLSGDNLIIRRDGGRKCRACKRVSGREAWRAKNWSGYGDDSRIHA